MMQGIKDVSSAAKTGGTDVKGYYNSLSDPNSKAEDGAEKLDKIKNAMEDLGKTYGDTGRDIAQKLVQLERNHAQTMQSIETDTEKARKSLQDLDDQYTKTMEDMDKGRRTR